MKKKKEREREYVRAKTWSCLKEGFDFLLLFYNMCF